MRGIQFVHNFLLYLMLNNIENEIIKANSHEKNFSFASYARGYRIYMNLVVGDDPLFVKRKKTVNTMIML